MSGNNKKSEMSSDAGSGKREEVADSASNYNSGGGSDATDKSKEKKHDSGAADLEKVTDYAEEKEIVASSSAALDDAIASVRQKQMAEAAQKLAHETELAKVLIKKEDVDLIVEEMGIPKAKAERTLREHQGNVVQALASLTN